MDSPVLQGVLGGLFAGLATGLGALAIYAVGTLRGRASDVLLASAAGIMLAATFFALLAPGIDAALDVAGSSAGAAGVVCAGLALGAGALGLVHRVVPHEHPGQGREGPETIHVRRIWLFVLAITLHNLPEGLAVGVGFGTGEVRRGLSLALGIGLQNVPEGLAVAAALTSIGYRRTPAFLISLGTGALEALGAAVGAVAATAGAALLPWSLAFAAGAMLFVIVAEIVPETHRDGSGKTPSVALLAGFLVMTALDVLLR